MSHKLYQKWTEGLEDNVAEQKKSLKSITVGEGRNTNKDLTVEKNTLWKACLAVALSTH